MLNPQTNERELCYVVEVSEIKPIPGKDRVECAVVGGWTVMVRKNQFHPGDLGIYFEIDSKVPAKEPFEFLAPKKYRIKIQKYKTPEGQFWSQGLLMSADDFGWKLYQDGDGKFYIHNKAKNISYQEGDFLTKELEVTYAEIEDVKRKTSVDKYKAMASRKPSLFKKPWARWLMRREWGRKLMFFFFGKKKIDNAGSFPNHLQYISKSDEERVENIPFILNDKDSWVKTTKIDGTSSLYLLERKPRHRYEYWVCSRNIRQLSRDQKTFHESNVYWEVNDKYNIYTALMTMLREHPEWAYVAIQGETAGCSNEGSPIQGDPHKFKELRFFAYNFITSDKGRWGSIEGADFLKKFNIPWVPIVDENYILPDTMEEFKLSADGPCEAEGASGNREGYVYRRVKAVDGKINSFKNVSREYLAKH